MLSKRSSCDLALRRADWRRFWPLLFLYAATWLMALPMSLWNRRWSVYNADTLQDALRRVESTIYDCVTASVVISAIFAVLLAMTLYGYLMNSRSVGLMHALPVNRTKQFFNHFLVGVEIFTLVHVFTALVSVLILSGYGVISWEGILTWFAVAELTSLFFFAFATLCAMVTGWVIAIPVIYVGVNVMFVAFYALLQMMFDLFYWGYSSSDFPAAISWLTPFYRLLSVASDTYHYDDVLGSYNQFSPAGWSTLIVYTVVAVVFTAVAWLFYKSRRSESAGDAIVFDWLRPIVLYVMSVVGGMGFGFLLYYLIGLDGSESLVALLVCQIIGGVVVYFAVEMLLNKSFKVFNRRGWLGAALLAVILIVIGAVVKFDLLGYERYVPDEDKVESVDFSSSMMAEYIYTDDDECIEKITAIHRAILAKGETENWELESPDAVSVHFSIDYFLENGTNVRRNYNVMVERGGELHKAMNEFVNLENMYAESFFRDYDPARVNSVNGGYYHNYRDESYDKYYADVTIDAETGEVITAETMPMPVKEQQLTAQQAKAIYKAIGEHIQRKSREKIDALDTGYDNYYGATTYHLEIHFSESDGNPVDLGVDAGHYDTWYSSNIPADCTEVMDLLIEFGLAESYDDLLVPDYLKYSY